MVTYVTFNLMKIVFIWEASKWKAVPKAKNTRRETLGLEVVSNILSFSLTMTVYHPSLFHQQLAQTHYVG